MVTRRKTASEDAESAPKKTRRAKTPEAREDQMIGMAVDLVERQLREGTASSQVISHYLKLGSSRERLEQERIRNENKLIGAKIELMEGQQRIEALIGDALVAFKSYAGGGPLEIEDNLDD